MRILVIGSGGREHALVWKIAQSKLCDKIFCAPGNGGIADLAECIDIKADDIGGLLDFCRHEKIELTVVGPEAPLTAGIADEFINQKLAVFGPQKAAARLESSKVFSKELMRKYGVPTADFRVFDDPDKADAYIEKAGAPCVVKADGLAAGKGVVVASTVDEAKRAIDDMMRRKVFGAAGERVIVEECLTGQEVSILVFTDSREMIPLATSQDHKRIFDGDKGPNTGGMGAYSPAPVVTPQVFQEIVEKVLHRTLDGLARENITYRGVLYAGLMLTPQGPKALEFNVRFGDPETQAILPRLSSDIVEVMMAVSSSKLSTLVKRGGLSWDGRACVCVVASAQGYPGEYEKGKVIAGLDAAKRMKDVMVFHAGTKREGAAGSYKYLTTGGRVLGIAGMGSTIKSAISTAYAACAKIDFDGMHYRKDIGAKAEVQR
jgi:phosphoribosylamine--glycine ligase